MSVAAIETRRSILLTGWCVLAAIVLALVIAVGVSVGELAIPLQNVFYAISNRTGLTAEPLNRIYESVIWDFRLSRALVAACCGAGLAICGVVLQSLLKNALAEPYVLGVSAGASTGAVSIVVLGLGAGAISLSAGAFAGAFAAFAFVALLTNGARGGNERTILAGVAASQLFNAITAYTISTSASAQQARDVMFWLLGSFSGVRWPEFQLVIVVVLAGLAVCLVCPGAGRVHLRRRCRRLAGDCCAARAPDPLHHCGADHRHHRQHGRLNRLCWPGGAARDAFLLWPAAPNVADRQRAGRGDIDGTGGHCVAPADCPAKSARWGSNRPGWGAFLCRDYLPLKE